jgi:hypothetical protein
MQTTLSPRPNKGTRQRLKPASMAQWLDRHSERVLVAFIMVFLVSGIATLSEYGLTWDEGLGNHLFGERNLRFLTSLDTRFLGIDTDLPLHRQPDLQIGLSPLWREPFGFPGFVDLPPTTTKYVFSYWLRWLNPIDAFHLFPVLLAGGFLWILYRFSVPRLGKFAALMAVVFLGTAPRFWGDMHFNVKDIPETIYFGATLMAYWVWREAPTRMKALAAGLLMGCALGTKPNAVFIPPVLFASIMPWRLDGRAWLQLAGHFRERRLHYAIMGASALSFYFLSWPYLVANPLRGLKTYWGAMFQMGSAGSTQWQIDPIRQVVTTMPEVMLLFFAIGLAIVLFRAVREDEPRWRLLAVWLIIPILRVSIPTGANFDGIRHFLEFLPAAALIAGVGVDQTARWIERGQWAPGGLVRGLVVGLLVLNLIQANLAFYPYLHIYYNQLTGGLHGARDGFLGSEASDYWASSYRQGMEWLSANAPENSHVAALIAPWIVEISGPVLLRPDIQPVVGSLPDFSIMKASKAPYYLMFILRGIEGESADEIAYTKKRGALEYELSVDQVPILQIYRFGGMLR